MGKILRIKGADFSQNAIEQNYDLVIEQGVLVLTPTSSNCGLYVLSPDGEPNWYKRMRVSSTMLMYIDAGHQCTITGLQGNGSVPFLRVDAAIYSSDENPGHDTFLHTLNGDTTDYYKFNAEGNNSYNFVAPYTGYYAFCFAGPNKTEKVSPANYNIHIIL